ncbi:MAG: (d)CMP kinase [Acidobacteriota bacterium]|nr:(d)CMP kinase [Acidobacteriota bacterium]MEC9302708.1 (d)CMP kinase [Acidobacteriota bacterium]MED5377509.1 (d)CMP kinase [Acidobacteriota bacterium]
MPKNETIIAIDGPSGAGKGTVARALAHELGYRHVDTGAMYRAVAWLANHNGIDLADESAVETVARSAEFDLDGDRMVVNGHDVTELIRTPETDVAAALVARIPTVRQVLVGRQRAIGEAGQLVMEGRDIGTVVFPEAAVKIYLDATPSERARRRAADRAHTSSRNADLVGVASALEARDASDRTREVSPLKLALDAELVDTTGIPIDDVVKRVLSLVRFKLDASVSKDER